jgi:hypothetical protein
MDDLNFLNSTNSDTRAITEKKTENVSKDLIRRHTVQIDGAIDTEETDGEWMQDKNEIESLKNELKQRIHNRDTYQASVLHEKTLYERERHYTIILGIGNVIALGGCIYMWIA